ncbi:fluoride efflux transporter CrcB [Facilibium subflavum]|uniref:fluoride efflux transporter CrcB n=1 Tax=Facilibium subflavum TaxID=2219058 RepID=UPI000E64B327|nr:fluoride efflux transporter CrcB [Facilibium subflavum]
MLTILLIGIGGGIGSICRFGLSEWLSIYTGKAFPYGILIVNILGCAVIGMLAAFIQKAHIIEHFLTPYARGLFITGFLGGFTTFSSFSLDALVLFQNGQAGKALLYILLSVCLSMIVVFIGFSAVERYL